MIDYLWFTDGRPTTRQGVTREREQQNMSETEEQFLIRMKELAPKRGYSWVERIPEEDLARAETMLGFPLPSLLRRIYLEVGDGAFGLSPLYMENFNGLNEMPLVDSYLGLRSEKGSDKNEERIWPEKLLIIYDWGCNIYSCLDCAHPEYRVLRNDNNEDLDAYAIEAPSFEQWLQAVLDDTLNFDWDTAEKITL
jgi:hypothetical protein